MLIVLEIAKMNILYSYLVQGFKVYAPVLQCRGYMEPEHINRGIISTKSNIFSLGVIIIEIVTGQRDYPDEAGVSSQDYTELVRRRHFL